MSERRTFWLTTAIVWLLAIFLFWLVFSPGGCASFSKQGGGWSAPVSPPPSPLGAAPGATGVAQDSASEQQGLLNAAVQGVTGISVQQALPWGFVPLMAWLMWLSHRRERLRIKGNGELLRELVKQAAAGRLTIDD